MGIKKQKQKIAMKTFQFVNDIAIGSNCPGVIIQGEYSSPKWELSKGIVQGAVALGGNCRGQLR